MISRTHDASVAGEALRSFSPDVDVSEWMSDPNNIVLTNSNGDLAIFEIGFKNVYTGHYYFKSRGRQAITAAREFLDEIFNKCYNIHVVLGMTPIGNKPARWISRQVGFKSYGTEELNGKEYEVFIITKKEFNNG